MKHLQKRVAVNSFQSFHRALEMELMSSRLKLESTEVFFDDWHSLQTVFSLPMDRYVDLRR